MYIKNIYISIYILAQEKHYVTPSQPHFTQSNIKSISYTLFFLGILKSNIIQSPVCNLVLKEIYQFWINFM